MSQERDKSSIFLTVVIVFLLVAMGVYAFIYREKILSFTQKYTKKKEQVEKHTIQNQPGSSEEGSTPTEPPSSKEIENPTSVEKEGSKKVDPSKEISSKDPATLPLYESEGDSILPPKPTKSKIQTQLKKKKEFVENLPGEPEPTQPKKVRSKKKRTAQLTKTKKVKRKYSIRSGRNSKSLSRRISRLERALGIRPKKGEKMEKRIARLETLLSKRKKGKKRR